VVHVGGHDAAAVDAVAGAAPHDDVLADLGDQGDDCVGHRGVIAEGRRLERLDVGGPLSDGVGCQVLDESAELLVASDEVGLAVDLDERPALAAGRDRRRDEAVGRGAVGALLGLGDTALAQHVDGCVDVAVGLLERPFAVHHPHAGFVAELFDQ